MDFVLLCKLIHILKPSYQVSVRQTRCLSIPTHDGHPCRWLYASRYQGTWGCKIKEYIAAPATFSIVEEETPTERLNDYVMTALRTSDGIDLSFVADRFGDEAARRLRRLSAADCRYNPTPRGFRIAEESWLLGDALTIPLLFD